MKCDCAERIGIKLRNRLISEDRYTDTVDEVLVKVANAKIKKTRLKNRGLEYGKVHYR